ncbi:DUF294 nucleotidyltransferase-like domain-containing protein [Faucicola boevrei]|uniref:DUF294 nucleotidyltransferase-like domain-containing protein n=1 Tax=Faucicola boevrei TaxID=346665 RepID=UPI00036ED965|nr:DUF294 nucleotidyltransferase-like domain-containing protein [Moraxella boevrei]
MNNALFYLNHPPFDVLTDSERNRLAKHSKISYLDKDTTVPSEWRDDFFVIIKGKIKHFENGELIAGLNASDWFFNKTTEAITSEQTLLYRLDGGVVDEIAKNNIKFGSLLFADLSARTQASQDRRAFSETQSLLSIAIKDLHEHIREPNIIDDTASLYDATCAMNTAHAKHILVKKTDNNQMLGKLIDKIYVQHIGICTQTDVCRAVADSVDFKTTPVGCYSLFNVKAIHHEQDVSETLVTMLENKVHRLPIIDDDGQIIGVIGQTELLNFLTNHTQMIMTRIDNATSLDELAIAVNLIGKYIRRQHEQGMKVGLIARAVQSLNRYVFEKAWKLIVPKVVFDNTAVFVMGSEGRGEQIMRTDQDNALIIHDNFFNNSDNYLKKEHLQAYADTFNRVLNDFGYPFCDGNIMMKNAMWQLSLADFKSQISSWYLTPDSQNLIYLATLLDAHFICGDKALFDELHRRIFDFYQDFHGSNFINRFALPTVQISDTASFWQKFTGGSDSDIDLKKAGIFPIVHGTRTLALEYGITDSSTKARLNALVKKGAIDEKLAKNTLEALEFFLSKRLAVSLITSDKTARKVNPNTLSSLERDLLKESLIVVKQFKSFIIHHYRLDVFGVSR